MVDNFYNQNAYQGVQQAGARFGWEAVSLASLQPADVAKNLAQFMRQGCDLIIVPSGFSMADQVQAAAQANPGQKFQIMEWLY